MNPEVERPSLRMVASCWCADEADKDAGFVGKVLLVEPAAEAGAEGASFDCDCVGFNEKGGSLR